MISRDEVLFLMQRGVVVMLGYETSVQAEKQAREEIEAIVARETTEFRDRAEKAEIEAKQLREELSHSILEATAHLVEAKADALARAEKAEAEVVKLRYVLGNYMSQFGQALEAYDIPYGPAQ